MNRNTQRSLVEAASRVLKEDIDSFVFSHDDDEGNYIRTPGTPVLPPGYGIRAGSGGSKGLGAIGGLTPIVGNRNNLRPGHTPIYDANFPRPDGGWQLGQDGLFHWFNWDDRMQRYIEDPTRTRPNNLDGWNQGEWYSVGGHYERRPGMNGLPIRVWIPHWKHWGLRPLPAESGGNVGKVVPNEYYDPNSWF